MEFAIASGVMAARAISSATKRKDFQSSAFRIRNCSKRQFVLKDMELSRKAAAFSWTIEIDGEYPQFIVTPSRNDVYWGRT